MSKMKKKNLMIFCFRLLFFFLEHKNNKTKTTITPSQSWQKRGETRNGPKKRDEICLIDHRLATGVVTDQLQHLSTLLFAFYKSLKGRTMDYNQCIYPKECSNDAIIWYDFANGSVTFC